MDSLVSSEWLANEIGATFREIRTPEILDKWLGGSERNIKQIFREARRYREPTVLLFDEFDSIISYAADGHDAASQAVNAVAGIFKQEMNGLIEANPNVIVVATTNFPRRVDESLIRSGRFDIKIAVPVPDEATASGMDVLHDHGPGRGAVALPQFPPGRAVVGHEEQRAVHGR